MPEFLTISLIIAVIALPLVSLSVLAFSSWIGRPLSEGVIARLFVLTFAFSFLCCSLIAVLMMLGRVGIHSIRLGEWFHLGRAQFNLALVVDALSISFAMFINALFCVIGVFSRKYLHREPGYSRFYF